MTTTLADHWPDVEPVDTSDPRPDMYRGDPPDKATCDAWMRELLTIYEQSARDVSSAKTHGLVRHESGRFLTKNEYLAWCEERKALGSEAMRRYRWLKEWKASTFHRKEREPREKERLSFNGQAIKAAVSRYGKLEDLLNAATAWIDDDTDETWTAFVDLVDRLNGTQEGQ